jgi:hypothetical protein
MPMQGLGRVKKALNVDIYNQLNDGVKGIYFNGLKNVIKLTPVDTGRARNNWFLTTQMPSSSTSMVSGGASFKELSKIPKRVLNKDVYFTNNLPYIGVLEYGGYSQPGTKKTKNGFSIQAPMGWVRESLADMASEVRKL